MRALVTMSLVVSALLVSARPTTQLSIHVVPASLDLRGDTVRVAYRVTNAPSSSSELFIFTVDAPSRPLKVEKPSAAAKRDFDTATEFGRSVASWGFMRSLVPGGTSPALAFSAVGLPGIVKYWAAPFIAPDTFETADVQLPADAIAGPGNSAADSGATVGVVPFPSDRSRSALLARLGVLTAEACRLGWIDNGGVCNSLEVKISQGDTPALINELQAQRGKHVNTSAYFLLLGNIRALPSS